MNGQVATIKGSTPINRHLPREASAVVCVHCKRAQPSIPEDVHAQSRREVNVVRTYSITYVPTNSRDLTVILHEAMFR